LSQTLQDEGILFHLRRQGETSLLAVWLTRHHGVLRTSPAGPQNQETLYGDI